MKTGKRILVIDDDDLFRRSIVRVLKDHYEVSEADTAKAGLSLLDDTTPDVIFLDIFLPDSTDLEVLRKIRERRPAAHVIMLTAVADIPMVVESIKLGAYNYVTKPVDLDKLLLVTRRSLESAEMQQELQQFRELQSITNRMVGDSPVLDRIRREIQIVAKSDSTVLIHGETGTGKELVARAIHAASSRADGPFVAVNCGAIPKDLIESEFFGHAKGAFTGAVKDEMGKFQLAHRGTILLDEIGELPLEAQVRLLRVLETQEFYPVGGRQIIRVDARVLASTNRNLHEMVDNNLFREDLYFRINVYPISIPPLRDRREDILVLAEYYMRIYNKSLGKKYREISQEAREILLRYPWKGNVREVRNAIERIVLSGEREVMVPEDLHFLEMQPETDLTAASPHAEGLDVELQDMERKRILQTLAAVQGDRIQAAEMLKLSLPSFIYRLKRLGITSEAGARRK